ncbi:MAG: hypothetical protein JWN24_83 [Phycisphaerales bacterium]|nr:hypothetical protein [Phycisphaerales bacterium]
MSTPPPTIQNLARHLLAGGPAHVESSNGDVTQAARACEKLRAPLTKLAGTAGFSSLLSRALALARRQTPSLQGLRVEADGSLAGINDIQQDADPAEAARHGGVILVAELLNLLVTFIGEPLTLRLVREAWPDASMEVMTLNTEEKP